jgi:glutamine amidotransferase/cyclase
VEDGTLNQTSPLPINNNNNNAQQKTQLVKRVVVALDVRSNDFGDLVVTKGDQYDVREKTTTTDEDGNNGGGSSSSNGGGGEKMVGRGGVRNLGKPVQLASRYYTEGADEIAFLNITSYRSGVIDDMPMLQVLEESSKSIFVPLTVGGGIRSYTDEASGTVYSAIEVASRYFRAGADKVSIGSDAVYAAEEYVTSNGVKTGLTSIETISSVYGVQAVVISIDPRRVYVSSPDDVLPAGHVVVELSNTNGPLGPNGETYCWYQCTVSGGRTNRPICAVTVARAVEALGAGEIMLNCIDMDGQCAGYDHALMNAVSNAVSIPVIASSGAGNEQHFVDVFENTKVRAALAAGMFHRREVEIGSVKRRMEEAGIRARIV